MYLLLLDCSSFYKNGLSYHNAKYKCQHKCGHYFSGRSDGHEESRPFELFFLPYPKNHVLKVSMCLNLELISFGFHL